MWNYLRPIIIILAVLLGCMLILLIGHEVIEARVFGSLTSRFGTEIRIGRRTGNLITGYRLADVEIERTLAQNNAPPSVFSTPSMTIHWELGPFTLTEFSWEDGLLILKPEGADEEEIEIGEGSLLPDDGGWLVSEAIRIGPESWEGSLDLRMRADAQEMTGSISIERLPSRFIGLTKEIPSRFVMPAEVILEMTLEGPPSNLRASGSVSNPLTRETYRF